MLVDRSPAAQLARLWNQAPQTWPFWGAKSVPLPEYPNTLGLAG